MDYNGYVFHYEINKDQLVIYTIFSVESTTNQNLSQEVYSTLTSDHSNFILTEVSSHFSPAEEFWRYV